MALSSYNSQPYADLDDDFFLSHLISPAITLCEPEPSSTSSSSAFRSNHPQVEHAFWPTPESIVCRNPSLAASDFEADFLGALEGGQVVALRGTGSAFSSSTNPDEDWTKISDLAERRRIRNRIAQRKYRKKLKRRLEDLEKRAGTSDGSSSRPAPEKAVLATNNRKKSTSPKASKRVTISSPGDSDRHDSPGLSATYFTEEHFNLEATWDFENWPDIAVVEEATDFRLFPESQKPGRVPAYTNNCNTKEASIAGAREQCEPHDARERYILKFCEQLYNSIRSHSSVMSWKQSPDKTAKISRLIVSFSVKLVSCSDTPQNRAVMLFLQRYSSLIAHRLASMIDSESRQQSKSKNEKPQQPRAGGMSLAQKMLLWDDTGACDNLTPRVLPFEEQRESMKEISGIIDEESYLDFEQRITYSQAYAWLVSALRIEALSPAHTNHTVISDAVLQSLPDSDYNKICLPDSRAFSFIVDLRILNDLRPRADSIDLRKACILTGSVDQQQATTFSEYVGRTWPWAGPKLIELLPHLSTPHRGTHSRASLLDGTLIRSKRTARCLRLDVQGSLISVAECGDVVARLALAPYQSSPDHAFVLKPTIHSMDGWKGVCKISYDLERYPLRTNNSKHWHTVLESPLTISDLTTYEFPVDASGMEVSYDVLQRFVQGPCEVVLQRADFFLLGQSGKLRLVDSDENTYLWDDVEGLAPCTRFKTTPLGGQLESAMSESRHFIKSQSSSPSPVDSDLFSLSDTDTEVNFEGQDSQLGQLYSKVACQLWDGFRQHRPTGSTSSVAASGNTTLVGAPSNTPGGGKCEAKGKKRGKGVGSDGDEDDCDDRPSRPNKKIKFLKPAMPKPFACPFWKDDQRKHRDCFKHTLTRLRDVKQHLTRRHSPFYCTRCLATFRTEVELDGHCAEVIPCMRDSTISLDGISLAQRTRISKRADPKLCEQDQWFVIWDIVFPGKPRPKTAYVDPEMAEELCRFQEYALSVGPGMLAAEIESHDSWSSGAMSDEERSSHLRRIIESNYLRVLDSFVAGSSSSSSVQTSPPAASTTVQSSREEESTAGGPTSIDTGSPMVQRASLMTGSWDFQTTLLPTVTNPEFGFPISMGNWTIEGAMEQNQMFQDTGAFNPSIPIASQVFTPEIMSSDELFAGVEFTFNQSLQPNGPEKTKRPEANPMKTQIA